MKNINLKKPDFLLKLSFTHADSVNHLRNCLSMKGIDMFCASQASTAICLSMDQPSSSSSAGLGGRAIDRHNPIIRDGRRFTTAPCLSQTPPINPLPYHQLHKSKKNKKKSKPNDTNINSSDDGIYKNVNHSSSSLSVDIKRKSIVTPPGSSRYLLGESTRFDGLSDLNNDPVLGLVPAQSIDKPSSPPHKPSPPSNQVFIHLFITIIYFFNFFLKVKFVCRWWF